MKPHLVRWHKDYAEKGLVVIDIDDGNSDGQDDLKEHVKKGGVPFPVLWDKEGKNNGTYGIKAAPSAYLVGVDGKVIWEGIPLTGLAEIEKLIKEELAKARK